MVLEQLYPLKLIEKNVLYALVLGIAYTIIGISTALLLFPEDPAIVAVALTVILILPTINVLFKQAENIESKRKQSNLLVFFKDHQHIFVVYSFLFLGILLVFSFFALVLPNLAANKLFENQLAVRYGTSNAGFTGQAIIGSPTFRLIFLNNLSVLLICLLTSFLFGDGALFIITWNASVWGTIFGTLAKGSALSVGKSPVVYYFLIFVIVFPHMILEALSYFSSAAAGGILSKSIIREKFSSPKFYFIARDTLLLILLSIFIVFIAAYVETFVLHNVDVYRTIISQSFR